MKPTFPNAALGLAALSLSFLALPALAQDKVAPVAPATSGTPAPGVDSKIRGEIQSLLDEMTRVVLATDVEAYMKLIDTSDLCFTNEQKYWAKDLKLFPPAEFTLKLGDELKASEGGVEGELAMTWAVKEKDGTPRKPRDIKYNVRFVNKDGHWLYAGEVWRELAGDNVLVKYEDDSLAELAKGIAQVFPAIRARVEEGFMIKVPRVQQVKLYTSMKHLQVGICLSYKDGLGGWNEPGESIRQLVRRNQTGEGSRHVLAHEFGHVCTFELGAKSNEMPWWVLEGVAELSAEYLSDTAVQRNQREVESLARKGKLPAWKELATWGEVSDSNYGKVYTLGYNMVGYISDQYGRERRVKWLKAMALGATIEAATISELGLSFDELNAKWRATLPEQDPPKPVEATDKPGEAKDAKPDVKPDVKKDK